VTDQASIDHLRAGSVLVSDEPSASVVVPVRNEAERIREQLDALASQDHDGRWEVVVVDNGSSDGSADVARSYGSRLRDLRIINAPEARGVNYVRNVGARASRGDVILFCDADDLVVPEWVSSMVAGLTRYDGVGGPLDLASLNDPENPAWFIREPLPADRLPRWYGFLPSAVGCNCGVRKTVYEDLGGFSESYAGGADETEFFWRLQLAGYELGFVPGAVVAYRFRSGLRANLEQVFRYHTAEPKLYRQFRPHGFPRRSARDVLASWARLLARAPNVARGREPRLRWLALLVLHVGRLVGSVRHRVVRL
jgi:glycosyltransferase involved in cell wall biosynthesis